MGFFHLELELSGCGSCHTVTTTHKLQTYVFDYYHPQKLVGFKYCYISVLVMVTPVW